ncbi:uncharacterized protein LOC131813082 [Mustela lutreola]|uniref:uncharacterized protein LOC131813082 n=1 Tax=Mustela lutreola TaxID=9666 RepID=UPI002797070E|nr:uncharacterized protein LOC131813082 [Mustela lutreola]
MKEKRSPTSAPCFLSLVYKIRRRNLRVWVQSFRSCTDSRRGHSSRTGSSRVCSSWTGSSRGHSSRIGSSRACSSWTGSSRACSSWTGSSKACSSWTGSSHRSHSPPCNPHRSHSPPCSPHRSHSPPCSPHRSHSWSRNRLAHSSTRACSSTRAHSSPHSWSHSPHSRTRSPHSWSHSPRNSHSSSWFWWVESGSVPSYWLSFAVVGWSCEQDARTALLSEFGYRLEAVLSDSFWVFSVS